MLRYIMPLAAVAITTALGLAGPAQASLVDNTCAIIGGTTYCDPAVLHVTSSTATGSDPVLLNNKTAFSVQDISGQNIDTPLTVYIATPVGAPVPTIASATYVLGNNAGVPVTVTANGLFSATAFPTASASDLYTYVGCVACDNSLNESNINTAYTADGLSTPASLSVYSFTVNHGFVGGDEINFTGSFANGDIVFPFAENVGTHQTTIFDTSWTNAGFVNCPPGSTTCGSTPPPPPPPDPVPEPSGLLVLGVGLLGLGYTVARRRS